MSAYRGDSSDAIEQRGDGVYTVYIYDIHGLYTAGIAVTPLSNVATDNVWLSHSAG